MVKKNGNGGNGNSKSAGPRRKRNGNGGNGRRKNGGPRIGVARGITAPLMNVSENRRPITNRVFSEVGSDFLTTVTVQPAPTVSQRVLTSIDVSPSSFVGTRLEMLSQLYERYVFVDFKLRYVPAVPNTIACQLLVYFDTDPTDDPEVGSVDLLIRAATAHTGSQQFNFNVPKTMAMPMRSDKQLYYTGKFKTNERFTLQSKAFVLQVTNPVDFNGAELSAPVTCGSLYMDWRIRFEQPQINPAAFNLNATAGDYTMIKEFSNGLDFSTLPNWRDRKSVV